MSESVVLCEGFHDRAFWAGWLLRLGCADPGATASGPRRDIVDPWGSRVSAGQFAFHSRSRAFVRVQPCGGREKVLPACRHRLRGRNTEALKQLVVNIDPDTMAGGVGLTTGLRRSDVLNVVRQFDPAAVESGSTDVLIDNGTCCISLIRWEAGDPDTPGVPAQQTLERLVCCAMCTAYPGRGDAIKDWLDSRPGRPQLSVKEFAWSHMAGWYAERGCDRFYQALWEDPAVSAELEQRLRAAGVWAIAESLAS